MAGADVVSGEVVQKVRRNHEIVRDVSWHPTQPTMVSASFDGTVQECPLSPFPLTVRIPNGQALCFAALLWLISSRSIPSGQARSYAALLWLVSSRSSMSITALHRRRLLLGRLPAVVYCTVRHLERASLRNVYNLSCCIYIMPTWAELGHFQRRSQMSDPREECHSWGVPACCRRWGTVRGQEKEMVREEQAARDQGHSTASCKRSRRARASRGLGLC